MQQLGQVPGTACIYSITHLPSLRCYTGITGNLSRRRQQHVDELNRRTHHVRRMQSDFDQDGIDAFVLKIVDYHLTFERELYWILKVPRDLRYNVTPNPDLAEAAFVEQAKGMSDGQLRAVMLDYEIKQHSRHAWAPPAKRLVGVRWWLKGGWSSVIWDAGDDRERYEVRLRKAPPEV